MSILKQIETLQKTLDLLKQSAVGDANHSRGLALAKHKIEKQAARDKGQKVLEAASKYREERKFDFVTKAGFVKTSTLPTGDRVYGKAGMLQKIFISGEFFTVKSGIGADAQVLQKKAPISKLYDYLQTLPKTQAAKLSKPAGPVRFNAAK